MKSKPPVFWVVDISTGKYDKQPLHGEIGSEALRGVVEAEASRIEVAHDVFGSSRHD